MKHRGGNQKMVLLSKSCPLCAERDVIIAELAAKIAVVRKEVEKGWRWCRWEDIQDAVGWTEGQKEKGS